MKINVKDFPKKVKPIRDNETYSVHDLEKLKHLVVSMTILHKKKSTMGHKHIKSEEVYIFIRGSGKMLLNTKKFSIKKGDIILVELGKFHRVFNTGNGDLVFMSVFEEYGGRGK